MALIIPEGYVQVILEHTSPNVDGGNFVTTLGYGESLGPFPVALADAAFLLGTAWASTVVPQMDTSIVFTRCTVNGATSSAEVPFAAAGAIGEQLPPPNVAALVTKANNVRGRRAQGRIFLYGTVPEGNIDERGFIDTTRFNQVQTAVSSFLADSVAAVDAPMVILQNTQRIVGGTPVGSPPISPPPVVTALILNRLVASQRRRLRR